MKNLKFLIIFAIALFACEEDNLNTGNYEGIFKVSYGQDSVITGETTLALRDSTFELSGNRNRIPAGGQGTWHMAGDKIVFEDRQMWTADFDWGLILSGEYEYRTFDDSLHIWSVSENARYEYMLAKK